jgi:hypothetical protein
VDAGFSRGPDAARLSIARPVVGWCSRDVRPHIHGVKLLDKIRAFVASVDAERDRARALGEVLDHLPLVAQHGHGPRPESAGYPPLRGINVAESVAGKSC